MAHKLPAGMVIEHERVELAVQRGAGAVVPPLTDKEALADFPSKVPVIKAEPPVLPALNANV